MYIICHRINTLEKLWSIPVDFGVEVDLRSHLNDIIINHEPFEKGILFEKWLEYYNHKFLILNIKEDGIENKVLKIIKNNNIKNYFLLDQSFPYLIKSLFSGENNTAIRISEYESIDTAIKLSKYGKWIWIDFFTKFPLDKYQYNLLKSLNFKLCIVSPELQGHNLKFTKKILKDLRTNGYTFEAVCTKYPILWKSYN